MEAICQVLQLKSGSYPVSLANRFLTLVSIVAIVVDIAFKGAAIPMSWYLLLIALAIVTGWYEMNTKNSSNSSRSVVRKSTPFEVDENARAWRQGIVQSGGSLRLRNGTFRNLEVAV